MTTNNHGLGSCGSAPETDPASEIAASASTSPRRPRYTLRPVVKPLSGAAPKAETASSAQLRSENEDDDGYDPYSDYHDGTARALDFEADPWR